MNRVQVQDLWYRALIAGEGPAVVLLHGFTGSAADWSPFLALAGEHGRAIAIDLLGHGRSTLSSEPARYAVPRQAADLAGLLDHLGAVPATIVGYSYGARIGLQLALDHPGHVTGLVLESPSAGIDDPAERAIRRAHDDALAIDLERDGIDAFARRWAELPMFAAELRMPADDRRDLELRRRHNDPAALAAALQGAGQGAMEPVADRLGSIRVPTAIVAGALDQVGVGRARAIARAIPHASVDVLDDASHALHREVPDRFAAWLADALDRIAPRPTSLASTAIRSLP